MKHKITYHCRPIDWNREVHYFARPKPEPKPGPSQADIDSAIRQIKAELESPQMAKAMEEIDKMLEE